jgi:hypothetical protein
VKQSMKNRSHDSQRGRQEQRHPRNRQRVGIDWKFDWAVPCDWREGPCRIFPDSQRRSASQIRSVPKLDAVPAGVATAKD